MTPQTQQAALTALTVMRDMYMTIPLPFNDLVSTLAELESLINRMDRQAKT